jgi:hypothetical protein
MICGEVGSGEPSSVTIVAWKVSAVAVAVPASAAVTARMPTRSAEFVLMMFLRAIICPGFNGGAIDSPNSEF